MGYKIENISMSDAMNRLAAYKYAVLYKIELVELSVLTGKIDSDMLLKECYEARFFDEKGELHLFEQDGQMKAVIVDDIGDDTDYQIIEYVLDNKYRNLAKYLVVKQYLEPDSDGQMNVVLTRLAGIGR